MQGISGYVVCKNGEAVKFEVPEEFLIDIVYKDPITIFSNYGDATVMAESFADLRDEDPQNYEVRKCMLVISFADLRDEVSTREKEVTGGQT